MELQNINHTHYLYHSTKNRQFFDKYETLVGEKYKGPVDSKRCNRRYSTRLKDSRDDTNSNSDLVDDVHS